MDVAEIEGHRRTCVEYVSFAVLEDVVVFFFCRALPEKNHTGPKKSWNREPPGLNRRGR